MTGEAELVGPLPVIRFMDGSRQAYTPPRNTCDIRYATCRDHHPACDCREAEMAENVTEYRAMFREVEQTILVAIEGHHTYAYTGVDDSGWSEVDELAQCKCQACAIARSVHIGFSECMKQHREVYRQRAEECRERQRAAFAAMYPPGSDEVPF